MAGGQERILRRRIKSVNSTKKITRAMELIAASRIVKAQGRVRAAQPYSEGITEVVRDLQAAGAGRDNPLLVARAEIRNVAFVAIAADRGLCGGYNSTVIRAVEALIKERIARGQEYTLITVGRKAESYFRYREYPIAESFSGFSESPTYEDARSVAAAITPRFVDAEIDAVHLAYTLFRSAGVQDIVVQPLMPLAADEPSHGATHADPATTTGDSEVAAAYEFEPSPDEILDALLPRYAEARIYAALLNAAASEHAARQRAMKAATDNAEDLILSLTRVMNRARQDTITTEIMEIIGGAEALKSGGPSDDRLASNRSSQGHDPQPVPHG